MQELDTKIREIYSHFDDTKVKLASELVDVLDSLENVNWAELYRDCVENRLPGYCTGVEQQDLVCLLFVFGAFIRCVGFKSLGEENRKDLLLRIVEIVRKDCGFLKTNNFEKAGLVTLIEFLNAAHSLGKVEKYFPFLKPLFEGKSYINPSYSVVILGYYIFSKDPKDLKILLQDCPEDNFLLSVNVLKVLLHSSRMFLGADLLLDDFVMELTKCKESSLITQLLTEINTLLASGSDVDVTIAMKVISKILEQDNIFLVEIFNEHLFTNSLFKVLSTKNDTPYFQHLLEQFRVSLSNFVSKSENVTGKLLSRIEQTQNVELIENILLALIGNVNGLQIVTTSNADLLMKFLKLHKKAKFTVPLSHLYVSKLFDIAVGTKSSEKISDDETSDDEDGIMNDDVVGLSQDAFLLTIDALIKQRQWDLIDKIVSYMHSCDKDNFQNFNIFSEDEINRRKTLYTLIEDLHNRDDEKSRSLKVFLQVLVIYQLFSPTLVDELAIDDLGKFMNVRYQGDDPEGLNPFDVIMDIFVGLIIRVPAISYALAFVIQIFHDEITPNSLQSFDACLLNILQDPQSDDRGYGLLGQETEGVSNPFASIAENESDNGSDAENTETAMEDESSDESSDDSDNENSNPEFPGQDEAMFKSDHLLTAMFRQRKLLMDQERRAKNEYSEYSVSVVKGGLEVLGSLMEVSNSALLISHLFMYLSSMYVSLMGLKGSVLRGHRSNVPPMVMKQLRLLSERFQFTFSPSKSKKRVTLIGDLDNETQKLMVSMFFKIFNKKKKESISHNEQKIMTSFLSNVFEIENKEIEDFIIGQLKVCGGLAKKNFTYTRPLKIIQSVPSLTKYVVKISTPYMLHFLRKKKSKFTSCIQLLSSCTAKNEALYNSEELSDVINTMNTHIMPNLESLEKKKAKKIRTRSIVYLRGLIHSQGKDLLSSNCQEAMISLLKKFGDGVEVLNLIEFVQKLENRKRKHAEQKPEKIRKTAQGDTPKKKEATPKKKEATPKKKEATPKKKEATPKKEAKPTHKKKEATHKKSKRETPKKSKRETPKKTKKHTPKKGKKETPKKGKNQTKGNSKKK